MMKCDARAHTIAAALIAVLALPTSVQADDSEPAELPVTMTLPDDFVESTELANPLIYKLRAEVHLGGLRSQAYARAWHSQRAPATVFVTWFVTQDAIELPDVAIHSEFEQLRTTPERVTLSPSDAQSLSFETGVSGQAATANLRWRHLDYQTETQARALAFQAAEGHLYFIQTDCVYPMPEADGAADIPEATCSKLLASIQPAGHVGALRVLQANAMAKNPKAQAEAPGTTESGGRKAPADTSVPSQAIQAPQLTVPAPGSQPMPAIAIQQERKRDYTSYLYILGGILLLVAFYFTARSRNASNDDDASTPE